MNQNNDPKLGADSTLTSITGGANAAGTGVGAATRAPVGRRAAAAVNPETEDAHWSANYMKRDYVEKNRPYTDYQPAYRYGWESRARLGDRPFRGVESDLERGWDVARGESKLLWAQAKHAASDAWHRAGRPAPVPAIGS